MLGCGWWGECWGVGGRVKAGRSMWPLFDFPPLGKGSIALLILAGGPMLLAASKGTNSHVKCYLLQNCLSPAQPRL